MESGQTFGEKEEERYRDYSGDLADHEAIGEARGEAKGMAKRDKQIALNLLKQDLRTGINKHLARLFGFL